MPDSFNLTAFLLIYALAIVSPGPNFFLVVGTALGRSRRAGLWTAFGVATGSGLFALAGLIGLILLLSTLPHFSGIIRFAGGGCLIWIGAGLLRSWLAPPEGDNPAVRQALPPLTSGIAFRTGLLTNLTNPKAWAFYLSLFTLVLQPGTPLMLKIILNLAMFGISLLWYGSVALLISHPRVQPRLARIQPLVQGVCGLLLIALGGRLLFGG